MEHSITSHNGHLTIRNPKTGGYRTFEIRTMPDNAKFAPGERVVSLLTGPDNESSYTGFGFLRADGKISVWKRHRGSVYETYAKMLENPEYYEALGCEYLFSVRCLRCNRELTTPESILSGIGPICAELIAA